MKMFLILKGWKQFKVMNPPPSEETFWIKDIKKDNWTYTSRRYTLDKAYYSEINKITVDLVSYIK